MTDQNEKPLHNRATEMLEDYVGVWIMKKTAYETALDSIRTENRKFQDVTDSFRKGNITTDEFLEARQQYESAGRAFDKAFAAEQSKPTNTTN